MNATLIYKWCLTIASLLLAGSSSAQPPEKVAETLKINNNYQYSITNDGSWERIHPVGKPIPWQSIKEAGILWKKRVWREIDIYEKLNMPLRFEGDELTGGGMLLEILAYYLKDNKLYAYTVNNDRFGQKLTKEEISAKFDPQIDSISMEDPETGLTVKVATNKEFNPQFVTKYRIKEDWIFDKNTVSINVRIVGIAPIIDIYDNNGNYKGPQTMFWLYYPDVRKYLAQYFVYNDANDAHRQTWDEYFEQKCYSAKITKISNSLNQRLEDIYNTDDKGKTEQLYEAKELETQMRNKEHDMWEY
ncbi:MAG: gliding motility protein GldN [Chitinophagia bacterium]|nr:gliding motility protein GldN [Chitinophagia bacterium]